MGVCFGWLVSWSSVGGRVEELCAGELLGKLVGWLVGSLASGLVGRWVGRLVGRLFGWRVGGLVGGLVNVAHWLVAAVCCLLAAVVSVPRGARRRGGRQALPRAGRIPGE